VGIEGGDGFGEGAVHGDREPGGLAMGQLPDSLTRQDELDIGLFADLVKGLGDCDIVQLNLDVFAELFLQRDITADLLGVRSDGSYAEQDN